MTPTLLPWRSSEPASGVAPRGPLVCTPGPAPAFRHRIGLTLARIGLIAFALTCRPVLISPPIPGPSVNARVERLFRSLKEG